MDAGASTPPAGRHDATGPADAHRPHAELEALIGRVGLGDRAAFAALYDATSGKLYAVCLRVLDRGQAAEDAMQDTYIKVWRNAGRYRATGHSPMTWLITIARNTAVDRLRARRDHADMADHESALVAPGVTPEQQVVARSEGARMVECLDELPDDRRRAIIGAYLDGRTYAELAKAADVPLNTIRTWLRRGLVALRECMTR